MSDDGKLDAESDSGEFWLLFGGFAPIGKKIIGDDEIALQATTPKLYRYSRSYCSTVPVFYMVKAIFFFDDLMIFFFGILFVCRV